jgi:predicted ester cyclase
MSAEENKAVLRREVEELYNHTGNLDVVEEIFSPDYVSHEPTSGEVRGIEGARQFAATFREAFPDLQNTIEDMVAEGDRVAMRFRGSGTHLGETEAFGSPTGNRMEITGISIERISEGKVVESWDNYDAMGMMQQLGFIPSPEEAQA